MLATKELNLSVYVVVDFDGALRLTTGKPALARWIGDLQTKSG
jgi:hypothetical protein